MYGSLALCLAVERGVSDAVLSGGVSKLFEERSLIIKARCESHCDVLVEGRNDAKRNAWADNGLLRIAPMAQSYTVVKSVERLLVVTCKAECVLNISLYTVGVEHVLSPHAVDHIKVLACMRYAVVAGVAHLVFHGVLRYLLFLEGERSLNVMLFILGLEQQLCAFHMSLKIIAGMLKVSAYTKILARLSLCEPVLTLNVILFLLSCVECGSDERE